MNARGLILWIAAGILGLGWLYSRPVFVVALFIILDIYKNILEIKIPKQYLPIKISEIGIITASFMFSYVCGLVLVAVYIFNKIYFTRIKVEDLYDAPILMMVSLLADFLSLHNYIVIGISLFVLRYILSSAAASMLSGEPLMQKIPGQVLNSAIAYYLFSNLAFII